CLRPGAGGGGRQGGGRRVSLSPDRHRRPGRDRPGGGNRPVSIHGQRICPQRAGADDGDDRGGRRRTVDRRHGGNRDGLLGSLHGAVPRRARGRRFLDRGRKDPDFRGLVLRADQVSGTRPGTSAMTRILRSRSTSGTSAATNGTSNVPAGPRTTSRYCAAPSMTLSTTPTSLRSAAWTTRPTKSSGQNSSCSSGRRSAASTKSCTPVRASAAVRSATVVKRTSSEPFRSWERSTVNVSPPSVLTE